MTTTTATTKKITDYPLIMIGAGGFLGWIAHEVYVYVKLVEMGLL